MAFKHGKDAYVSLDANDVSAFCDSLEPSRSADSHDTTTFGQTGHVYQGGLTDGTFTASGTYDDGATGPKAVIEHLLGTVVTLIYRPEGTGSGKPSQTCDVLVTGYSETTPVADMIKWKVDLQISGAVTTADQA